MTSTHKYHPMGHNPKNKTSYKLKNRNFILFECLLCRLDAGEARHLTHASDRG